jgi:hypothetical protein
LSDEKPETSVITTVPGKNGGRLLAGGKKGHRGGGGRPPDEIRKALRGALWKHRARLEKFAMSDDPAVAMKAIDLLAKYGLGTTFTPTDTKGETLNSGVLAVPAGVSKEAWGEVAKAQQADQLTKPESEH